ncbi:hypothetical protein G5B10_11775 [Fluviicola sp. SGL-29]|nr:hypothetical protein [Fluviicola sp. SGL-29]
MKNLSRNCRKNKRKQKNKMKRKQSKKSNIYSRVSTVFSSGELGISLQKMWINEQIGVIIPKAKENNADLVLVTPFVKNNEVFTNIHFLKNADLIQVESINSKEIVDNICSYYEMNKGEGKLILFFLNEEGRLSCYTCNANLIPTKASSSSLYHIKNDEIHIDFELIQWLFELSEEDILLLKSLDYFPVNKRMKDLSGELREVDPILVAIFDFISACDLMFEVAKKEGFSRLLQFDDCVINIYHREAIENSIAQVKSIFKKLAPETYKYFFEESNSTQKAG